MLLETTVLDNGGSIYVRIPGAMAEYFKLRDKDRPLKCKIEDIEINEAKITFEKW